MAYRYNKKKSKELIFKENLPQFVKKINPIQMLPYLPCLPRQAMEEIQAEQKNYGPTRAVFLLYQQLIVRSDKWFEEFTQALRSEDINQPELADLLDPQHNDLKEPDFKPGQITAHTPLRQLCQSVVEVLLVLDHEGPLQTWRDLAAILGYSVEQVNRIEAYRSGSYTRHLLEHWMRLNDANLGTLLQALEILERYDLITEIEKITKFKYLRDVKSNDDVQSQSNDVILFHRNNQRTDGAASCNQNARDTSDTEEPIKTSIDDQNSVRCNQIPGDTGRFSINNSSSNSKVKTERHNQGNSYGGVCGGNSDTSGVSNQSTDRSDRCSQGTSSAVADFGHSDSISGKDECSDGTDSHCETNNAKQDNSVLSRNNERSKNIVVKDTEICGKSEDKTPSQYDGRRIHHSNNGSLENENLESQDSKKDQSKTINLLEYNDPSGKETLSQFEMGQETVECENEKVDVPVQNIRVTTFPNTHVSITKGETTLSIENPVSLNMKSLCEVNEDNEDHPMNEIDEHANKSLNLAKGGTTLIPNIKPDDSIENNEYVEFNSLTDENFNKSDKKEKYLRDKIIDTANSLGNVGTGVLGIAGIATLALLLVKKL